MNSDRRKMNQNNNYEVLVHLLDPFILLRRVTRRLYFIYLSAIMHSE